MSNCKTATYRVDLSTGKFREQLSRKMKINGMVLEKWKFENLDITPVPTALSIHFKNNVGIRDEVGNIDSNSIQLHWDGVATGFMAGDSDSKNYMNFSNQISFNELAGELRDQDGNIVTADFLTLWFIIF